MRQRHILLLSLLCLTLLSGCRSSRHAASTGTTDITTGAATPATTVTPSLPTTPTVPSSSTSSTTARSKSATGLDAITAKMNLTLESGKKNISVGGTYRLKRNEVIQLNLTYNIIISINVGTLELTPDYILLIDRLNKRYCQVAYSEVPSLAQAGIDFEYLQSIFWGEAEASPNRAISWEYDKWTGVGQGQFPQSIQFTLRPSTATYKARFALSDIQSSNNWETRTEVSSRYTPVSLDAVLNALMSIAK